MAKAQDYAWIAVRVRIPDTHTSEMAVEEVRKSIGFGKPIAVLLGIVHLDSGPKGTDPVIVWTPAPAAKGFIDGYVTNYLSDEYRPGGPDGD